MSGSRGQPDDESQTRVLQALAVVVFLALVGYVTLFWTPPTAGAVGDDSSSPAPATVSDTTSATTAPPSTTVADTATTTAPPTTTTADAETTVPVSEGTTLTGISYNGVAPDSFLRVVHVSGDTFAVVVDAGPGYTPENTGALTLRVGDRTVDGALPGNDGEIGRIEADTGETIELVWTAPDGSTSRVITTYEVPSYATRDVQPPAP